MNLPQRFLVTQLHPSEVANAKVCPRANQFYLLYKWLLADASH
jgi:hypothetical protein